MVTSTPGYTVVRFSSRTLPDQGRGKALEALPARRLLPPKFVRYGNAAPRVDLVNRTMPGLRILTASYASVRREGVRQEGDLLYLCMTLSGTTLGSQRGREMVLGELRLQLAEQGQAVRAHRRVVDHDLALVRQDRRNTRAPVGYCAACSEARNRNDETDREGYRRAEAPEQISRGRRRR